MADVKKLAPIILRWETNTPIQDTIEEQWKIAVKKGYSNKPTDKGGPTMCGITLTTYTTYCNKKGKKEPTIEDLKKISLNEWFDVLKSLFWDKMKADRINNQSIANLCVNSVWGSGLKYIKIIQRVLGVEADGIVGPVTLAAINDHPNQRELFGKLWERRRLYFVNLVVARPSDEANLKGWMNRLYDFKYSE
jgi:lysozyme family protein